ncbi:ABC transporter ATP-binding protein [Halovivax gelatinilyticus]|uniref:ABC transporter ATP-binding protein n=1 Tax=Halovivax gelatinilyticus TaxID=2961597 RepID=UPI0020CA7E96|nr:ABC transporter ATP-binding protein [Halovivax gelatinilyticus]
MADPLVDVSDLHVHFNTYEGRHRVLNGVDLTIEEGETVALVGETGCGKSVTADTILGVLPQPPGEIVEGEIRYRGEEVLADPNRHEEIQADEMSMIFQDPMSHLSPVFTIGDMMSDILTYQGERDVTWREIVRNYLGRDTDRADEIRDRSADLLERLQIPDPEGVLDRYPMELSGGMRQRVMIAMALLNEPEFLIADEPTTALDVTVQEQIIDLFKDRLLGDNLSMLYITHNLGVARELADRIYVMYAGTIVESGETQELFDSPLHPYTKGLIESIPKLTDFDRSGIPGTIPDYTDPPAGCRFHPRCPAAIEGTCDVETPPDVTIAAHDVHCHLYEEGMTLSEATTVAENEIEYAARDASEADARAVASTTAEAIHAEAGENDE